MIPPPLLGLLIALAGSALGLLGAWGTSAKERTVRHWGFTCWLINSPLIVISLVGVSFGWWDPMNAIVFAPLNLLYWYTAWRGWRNTR